jgi:hypothetical protein
MGRLLLNRETFFDVWMRAVNNDPVSGDMCRKKERKTLDMVPVGMAQEQVRGSLSLAESAVHKTQTKHPDP